MEYFSIIFLTTLASLWYIVGSKTVMKLGDKNRWFK